MLDNAPNTGEDIRARVEAAKSETARRSSWPGPPRPDLRQRSLTPTLGQLPADGIQPLRQRSSPADGTLTPPRRRSSWQVENESNHFRSGWSHSPRFSAASVWSAVGDEEGEDYPMDVNRSWAVGDEGGVDDDVNNNPRSKVLRFLSRNKEGGSQRKSGLDQVKDMWKRLGISKEVMDAEHTVGSPNSKALGSTSAGAPGRGSGIEAPPASLASAAPVQQVAASAAAVAAPGAVAPQAQPKAQRVLTRDTGPTVFTNGLPDEEVQPPVRRGSTIDTGPSVFINEPAVREVEGGEGASASPRVPRINFGAVTSTQVTENEEDSEHHATSAFVRRHRKTVICADSDDDAAEDSGVRQHLRSSLTPGVSAEATPRHQSAAGASFEDGAFDQALSFIQDSEHDAPSTFVRRHRKTVINADSDDDAAKDSGVRHSRHQSVAASFEDGAFDQALGSATRRSGLRLEDEGSEVGDATVQHARLSLGSELDDAVPETSRHLWPVPGSSFEDGAFNQAISFTQDGAFNLLLHSNSSLPSEDQDCGSNAQERPPTFSKSELGSTACSSSAELPSGLTPADSATGALEDGSFDDALDEKAARSFEDSYDVNVVCRTLCGASSEECGRTHTRPAFFRIATGLGAEVTEGGPEDCAMITAPEQCDAAGVSGGRQERLRTDSDDEGFFGSGCEDGATSTARLSSFIHSPRLGTPSGGTRASVTAVSLAESSAEDLMGKAESMPTLKHFSISTPREPQDSWNNTGRATRHRISTVDVDEVGRACALHAPSHRPSRHRISTVDELFDEDASPSRFRIATTLSDEDDASHGDASDKDIDGAETPAPVSISVFDPHGQVSFGDASFGDAKPESDATEEGRPRVATFGPEGEAADDAAAKRQPALDASARQATVGTPLGHGTSNASSTGRRAHFTPVALRAFRLLDCDADGLLSYRDLRVFALFFGHAEGIDDFCVQVWKDLDIRGAGITSAQWLRLVAGGVRGASLSRPLDAAGLLEMIEELDQLREREAVDHASKAKKRQFEAVQQDDRQQPPPATAAAAEEEDLEGIALDAGLSHVLTSFVDERVERHHVPAQYLVNSIITQRWF